MRCAANREALSHNQASSLSALVANPQDGGDDATSCSRSPPLARGITRMSARRYDNGLLKLAQTEVQVEQMQRDLEVLQPKLVEATAATDVLLAQIAKDTEVANANKASVEVEEATCTAQAQVSAQQTLAKVAWRVTLSHFNTI